MDNSQNPWRPVDTSRNPFGEANEKTWTGYKGPSLAETREKGEGAPSLIQMFKTGYDSIKELATATINDDARDLEATVRLNPLINKTFNALHVGRSDADPYKRSLFDNAASVGNTTLNVLGLIPGVQGLSAGAKFGKAANNIRKYNKTVDRVNKLVDAEKAAAKTAKVRNADIAKTEKYWKNQTQAMNFSKNLKEGKNLPFDEMLKGPYKMNPLKRYTKDDIIRTQGKKGIPRVNPPSRNAWGKTMDLVKVQSARQAADHLAGGYKKLLQMGKSGKYAAPTTVTHDARTRKKKK